jgi:hypothetical protein
MDYTTPKIYLFVDHLPAFAKSYISVIGKTNNIASTLLRYSELHNILGNSLTFTKFRRQVAVAQSV